MPAVNTDKLRKLSRRWVGQIAAGGVGDETTTTIPLSATTNLATDTAVTLVIDRVDSSGVATPSLEETIVGVVSGSNIINSLRGVEGTAQAHLAGAVVEVLVTADGYNDIIDHLLVGHLQDGSHASSIALTASTIALSQLSTNTTLSENSDTLVPSQKAVKTHVSSSITTAKADLTKYSNLNLPQGQGTNYKIVPSVASNNLTVAIKGLDGNDPSASNPVYCRIGDTVRSITSALSVTKNAGTNWCNAGSAELATKEIDYFVYLGYNATDGVVLGFSRIPYATLYSDFSATTTNEKYAGISTITTAAAGDNYENIGRFAATLSAGAGYTWTVPTFTTANLIQRPIYETRKLTWTPVTSYSGGGGSNLTPTVYDANYEIRNNTLIVEEDFANGATFSAGTGSMQVTLPMSIVSSSQTKLTGSFQDASDNYYFFPGIATVVGTSNQQVLANMSIAAGGAPVAIAASDRFWLSFTQFI